MNAKNAKDYLPLVQALAEGKTIQQRTTSNQTLEMEWRDDLSPTWVSDPQFYRIKPEPRRWWLVKVADCWVRIFPEKEQAEEWVVVLMRAGTWTTKGPNPSELIELQEVTPNHTP